MALLALVLYACTTSRAPIPGESARLMYAYSGLDPFPPLLYPLWGNFIRFLTTFDLNLPWVCGISSALFGAGCIWAFYRLLSEARFDYLRKDEAPNAGLYSGLAGSLYLLISAPFWMAATRSHHLTFHVLLLLLFLLQAGRYNRTGKPWNLVASGLWLGIGVPESPIMLLVAPPAILFLILACYRHRPLSLRAPTAAAILFLAGLTTYAVAVVQFMRHPAHAWIGQPSAPGVLRMILEEQLTQIHMISQAAGWILILLLTVVPWLLVFVAARQTPESEHFKGTMAIHSLALCLALALLLQGRYTPFYSYHELGLLIVTPYLLVAATFGYTVAYGYVKFIDPRSSKRELSALNRAWLILPTLALATLLATVNYRWIDKGDAASIRAWADRVVSGLPSESWIVTDGHTDGLLAFAARDAGQTLHLLNPRHTTRPSYREYVADTIHDPQVAALARINVGAALRYWVRTDPEIAQKLAFLPSGKAWEQAGLVSLPDVARYRSIQPNEPLPMHQIIESNRSFWQEVLPDLLRVQQHNGYIGRLAAVLVRHSARVANDAGDLYQAQGLLDEALDAFETAYRSNPQNISALANLYRLWGQLGQSDEMAVLWPALEAALERTSQAVDMAAIQQEHGTLAEPSLLYLLSTAWSSGLPNEQVRAGLARVAESLCANARSQAIAAAQQLADEAPNNPQSWILLGMLTYNPIDREGAEQAIHAMQSRTLDWTVLASALADLALKQGDPAGARSFWEQALTRLPTDTSVLESLLQLGIEAPRSLPDETQASYISRLLKLEPSNAIANHAAGRLALEAGDIEKARLHIGKAVAATGTAAAHLDLAAILVQRKDFDEALNQLSRAIELGESQPDTWNRLAQSLVELGRNKEARGFGDLTLGLPTHQKSNPDPSARPTDEIAPVPLDW